MKPKIGYPKNHRSQFIRKRFAVVTQIAENNRNSIRRPLEFVTCGVELLRGHCTDIPADQGSCRRESFKPVNP